MKVFEKTAIFPVSRIFNKPESLVVQHLFKTINLLELAKLFIKKSRMETSLIQGLSEGLVLYKAWLSILMDMIYNREKITLY